MEREIEWFCFSRTANGHITAEGKQTLQMYAEINNNKVYMCKQKMIHRKMDKI